MKKNVITILLLLSSINLYAQSSVDYFNRAANEYIYQSDQAALNTINNGLIKFPGDKNLTNLKEKIEKEKQNQQQQKKQPRKCNTIFCVLQWTFCRGTMPQQQKKMTTKSNNDKN